jgi:DNA-binding transcriptional regulator YiaG
MSTISYNAEVRHDGRLHLFVVPKLKIPVCRACGEKVFTEKVDDQINAALRSHLHLLTPEEIHAALQRIDLTQKAAAAQLGIAEATLSRWLTSTQIQTRAMDNLLRVFFAFPQVRDALGAAGDHRELGSVDIVGHGCTEPNEQRPVSTRDCTSWLHDLNGNRGLYRQVQDVVTHAGTTWGTKRVA